MDTPPDKDPLLLLLGRLCRFAWSAIGAVIAFPLFALDLVVAAAFSAFIGWVVFVAAQVVGGQLGLPPILSYLWAGAVAACEFAYVVRRRYVGDEEGRP